MTAAIVHTSVILHADTEYAASPEHGQLWVGTTVPGTSDLCITGDADALYVLAQALRHCSQAHRAPLSGGSACNSRK